MTATEVTSSILNSSDFVKGRSGAIALAGRVTGILNRYQVTRQALDTEPARLADGGRSLAEGNTLTVVGEMNSLVSGAPLDLQDFRHPSIC